MNLEKLKILTFLSIAFLVIGGAVTGDQGMEELTKVEDQIILTCNNIGISLTGSFIFFDSVCHNGGPGSALCSSTSGSTGQSCSVSCNDGYYACCPVSGAGCHCKEEGEVGEN